MRSRPIRVSIDFCNIIHKERNSLAKKLKIPARYIPTAVVTKVISNKLSGKVTRIKVGKKGVKIVS